MKAIYLLIYFLFSISCFSQYDYDLRKVKWGMSKEDVIKSELPIQCERKDNGDIEYEAIEVNNLTIKLVYEFKNERLNGANYYLFFKNENTTCKDKIKLSSKLMAMDFIFKNLKEKAFKFNNNWMGYTYVKNAVFGYNEKNTYGIKAFDLPLIKYRTDWMSAQIIDSIASKNKFFELYISLENPRTYVSFTFNEFKNNENRISELLSSNSNNCNFWYFNEIARIKYSPSYNLEKELNKSQF